MTADAGPFESFIGNAAAVGFLRAAVRSGRSAHAYLLTGPAQVGKHTLAQAVAAGLVCQAQPTPPEPNASTPLTLDLVLESGSPVAPPSEPREPSQAIIPCGRCRACLKAAKGSHPDILVVAPESGKRGIVIEQIRQLEHMAGMRPYEAERKVFILLDVETMTEPAANALLKTLEEPPSETVLVLTASDSAQVLPTIASRCQEVPLRAVPTAELQAALIAREAEPDLALLLARLAAGRPGWSLATLADPTRLEHRQAQVETLESLLAQAPVRRLAAAGTFGDATSTNEVLDVWLTWWRDALLLQQGCAELVTNVDRLFQLEGLGAVHDVGTCWQALVRIQEARQQVDANVNVRLAVEALLLDLPQAPASPRRSQAPLPS
jgi:DNA polymerase III subunit delta'